MPGNELEICELLFNNRGKIELDHIGIVTNIGAPNPSGPGYMPITRLEQLGMISTEAAGKKTDVYINGIGVSLKQTGGSFPYNRLQRANLQEVYKKMGFTNIDDMLSQVDSEVCKFHQGLLDRRNRPWQDFFTEGDFKVIMEFLMMKGSPNLGLSKHTADLILEAPPGSTSADTILVYTFPEYFKKYKDKFKIAIRRQWVGQASKSEHGRASSLARNPGNAPWVFEDVAGEPSTGWRDDVPKELRRTVYFLMIEKVTGGLESSTLPLPL